MPVAPRLSTRIAADANMPGVGRVQYSPENFGSGMGQAAQQIGQEVVQTANVFRQAEETRGQQAALKYEATRSADLKALQGKQGVDAMSGLETYQKTQADHRKTATEGLSEYGRGVFEKRAAIVDSGHDSSAQSYALGQWKGVQEATYVATMDSTRGGYTRALATGDDAQAAALEATIREDSEQFGAITGKPTAFNTAYAEKQLTQAKAEVLGAVMKEDPRQGVAFYEKHKGTFGAQEYAMAESIATAKNQIEGEDLALATTAPLAGNFDESKWAAMTAGLVARAESEQWSPAKRQAAFQRASQAKAANKEVGDKQVQDVAAHLDSVLMPHAAADGSIIPGDPAGATRWVAANMDLLKNNPDAFHRAQAMMAGAGAKTPPAMEPYVLGMLTAPPDSVEHQKLMGMNVLTDPSLNWASGETRKQLIARQIYMATGSNLEREKTIAKAVENQLGNRPSAVGKEQKAYDLDVERLRGYIDLSVKNTAGGYAPQAVEEAAKAGMQTGAASVTTWGFSTVTDVGTARVMDLEAGINAPPGANPPRGYEAQIRMQPGHQNMSDRDIRSLWRIQSRQKAEEQVRVQEAAVQEQDMAREADAQQQDQLRASLTQSQADQAAYARDGSRQIPADPAQRQRAQDLVMQEATAKSYAAQAQAAVDADRSTARVHGLERFLSGNWFGKSWDQLTPAEQMAAAGK